MNESPPPAVQPAPMIPADGAELARLTVEMEQSVGVRKAVALEYRQGRSRAPVVSATGRGDLAERIIALARQHGIYVQSDPGLVELLSRLRLGAEIPPQLYEVVAEVLAFVYNLNSTQTAISAQQPASVRASRAGTPSPPPPQRIDPIDKKEEQP